MNVPVAFSLAAVALCSCIDSAGAKEYAGQPSDAAARYTFSWPLDGAALKPRGGTTKGPPVELDQAPSAAWKALQAKDLSPLERDRRAIRAMAGTYRVTFDFLEVTSFGPDAQPKAPYQSWGTEKIYVDRDEPQFISLVHILEMRFVMDDGSSSEPMVTKHWRQDWRYSPPSITEYRGRSQWARRALGREAREGSWLQAVYQVDESPRYASLGRWVHTRSFSTWQSGETWRPLPRREWSVRDDYHVLIGTNRHTVLGSGWVQEENNLKAVLTAERALAPQLPYVGREYGVARYERIRDADFAAADQYYEKTKTFWRAVRARWDELFERRATITLRGPVDQLGLFRPLFERAELIAEEGGARPSDDHDAIGRALEQMLAE